MYGLRYAIGAKGAGTTIKRFLIIARTYGITPKRPVTLPDDETIMDRLNITEPQKINEIWKSLFEQSYGRGELFTLQLHPERIETFANSLESGH